jgi:stage II sporulation protein D
MRKILIICLMMACCLSGISFASDTQKVKIGLTYQSSDYNQGSIELTQAILKEGDDSWSLLSDAVKFKLENGYRVLIGEKYDDYDSFKADVTDLLKIDSNITIGFGNGYRVYSEYFTSYGEAESYIEHFNDLFDSPLGIVEIDDRIAISGGMLPVLLESEGISLTSDKSFIDYTNRVYRGDFMFAVVDHMISVINHVEVDDYLYSVVPCEVEYYWPSEALKAQAIVARTYLLKNLGRFNHLGFDLTDTSSSQVYKGTGNERSSTTAAVDETKNMVVTYQGSLINAYYHASSGGQTANSENVWSGTVPYLKAIDDKYSIDAPNATWSLTYTASQLRDVMNEKGYEIDEIKAVGTGEISDDGRVQNLVLTTNRGSIDLVKEEARRVLGYSRLKSIFYSVSGSGQISIMSNLGIGTKDLDGLNALSANGMNTIQSDSPLMIRNAHETSPYQPANGNFVFSGKGWGHGVGLSQWGAKTMAEQGYNADEIIKYYYRDVEIVER